MSNLTPVKSFEEYQIYANSYGYSYAQNLYLPRQQSPSGFDGYVLWRDMPLPQGLTEDEVRDFYSVPNEINFWMQREAIRFLEGIYMVCQPIAKALRNQPDAIRLRHFTHMLHTSIEDTTMVAYTPDHKYGIADRQVKMKIGRYLQKFYADVFSQEQIRDIANNVQGGRVEWAYGSAEIRRVYENGPSSCMVSCGDHNGTHPVEVYGYQYADGSYQFGLAYMTDIAGKITARCLCDLKSKKYTRFYGDDGPILGSKLNELGYAKVSSMDDLGCRLKDVGEYRGQPIMAYLDGDGKNVDKKYDRERNQSYWLWCENGHYCADEPDGLLDEDDEEEDSVYCECCNSHVPDDDARYSDYHNYSVCDSCAGDDYVWAYYRRGNDTTLVYHESVIEVGGDYYVDDSSVLSYHDIITREDGEYDFESNCKQLYDNRWVEYDHEDLVCLIDGDYALADDDDVVRLINGDYALDTDDIVELENDHGYALKDSDSIVEIDGDWYHKGDDAVALHKGEWMLAEDVEDDDELDGADAALAPLPVAANAVNEEAPA